MRHHVAVVGRIDLNSDGSDRTAEFVKAIEKQGAIVDLWIDWKDLSLHGARKAITFQTDYLILGEVPELEDIRSANEPRRLKDLNLVLDMQRKAREKAVYIVNARRYLTLAGMTVPPPQPDQRDRKSVPKK